MYEWIEDPFYERLKRYENLNLVPYYVILADEHPYSGLASHTAAVSFAMRKLVKESEEHIVQVQRKFGKEFSDKLRAWHFDMAKASAVKIDADSFLALPAEADRRRFREYEVENDGGNIPYWYAFLEPPHPISSETPKNKHVPDGHEDLIEVFQSINALLFPNGSAVLEVYRWSTDWSDYFDAGREWWGASCWSIYDKSLNRYIVIFVSSTD